MAKDAVFAESLLGQSMEATLAGGIEPEGSKPSRLDKWPYRPPNFGARFSRKAATPSAKSSP
jgi:hypothetical protein